VPSGTVFALYVALYCAIRLPLETIKIDPADHFFGQRVNVWVAAIALLIGIAWFLLTFRRRQSEPPVVFPQVSTATTHTPTPRPEAAIAARRSSKQRKK
jgi:prolipoprotein diacylglyceryltransferase